jgi:Fe2+ transport system protein FeoA
MTLFDLQQGEQGIITEVRGKGAFRKRITEMGFVKGKLVTVIKESTAARSRRIQYHGIRNLIAQNGSPPG